jgi:hypothetical protein
MTLFSRCAVLGIAVLTAVGVGVVPAGAADDAAPMVVTFADGGHRAALAARLHDAVAVGPRAAASRLRPAEAAALRAQPGVVRVEPDVVYH